MVLSNAERQARYRAHRKAMTISGCGLTPEQIADRDAVMAEPIWPVPKGAQRDQMPRFLGWSRYEWSEAPLPLIEFLGMQPAWEGWRAEKVAMEKAMHETGARLEERANAICAEVGDAAREIRSKHGSIGLISRYEADSTLGQKQRRKRRVT